MLILVIDKHLINWALDAFKLDQTKMTLNEWSQNYLGNLLYQIS